MIHGNFFKIGNFKISKPEYHTFKHKPDSYSYNVDIKCKFL